MWPMKKINFYQRLCILTKDCIRWPFWLKLQTSSNKNCVLYLKRRKWDSDLHRGRINHPWHLLMVMLTLKRSRSKRIFEICFWLIWIVFQSSGETENLKKFLIFQEMETLENFFYFKSNFQNLKNKLTPEKILMSWEIELASPKKLNETFYNFIAPKTLNKTFLYSW